MFKDLLKTYLAEAGPDLLVTIVQTGSKIHYAISPEVDNTKLQLLFSALIFCVNAMENLIHQLSRMSYSVSYVQDPKA